MLYLGLSSDLRRRRWWRGWGRRSRTIRAAERPTLTEHDLKLLLQWLIPQQRVQGLAARHQVLLRIRAAIRLREQVLNACIGLLKRSLAEEAVTALFEE